MKLIIDKSVKKAVFKEVMALTLLVIFNL
ncbi:hypothetical protein GP2143_15531 [marine gamma proteobacterium HTCC2143]|uniref:Uncharacterized protein n=1 Tax=marine gamma proteobacterium HTCC2143 TaxID=247633 RepID=A0Y976_9GAMM|nr:hypothetical protein GP2143_15531 [marine gamma proteobacterium HTCC2143]